MSRFKGGTLIAEDVRDLDEHRRRMADADAYRPVPCLRCGSEAVHVHCRPERHPKREPTLPPVVPVLQFRCGDEECGATWRILPIFLARHLWHAWRTVERVVRPGAGRPSATAPPIAPTTEARWKSRLSSSARVLCVLLAMSGGAELVNVAMAVGLAATRGHLVDAFAVEMPAPAGQRLSTLAAHVHRLERGVRLM